MSNNLYPPIMKSYMPAYSIDTEKIAIYFGISDFNVVNDIKNVQVTITNQKTNKTLFSENDNVYDGIYCIDIEPTEDTELDSSYRYYIEIDKSLFKDNKKQNTYYKIQIRFSNMKMSDSESISSFINEYSTVFSEWSTVCLMCFVEVPKIQTNTLTFEPYISETATTVYQTNSTVVDGKLIYTTEEDDYLKSYRVRLYDSITNVLKDDSDWLYPQNKNELKYTFEYAFQEYDNCLVELEINTINNFNTVYYSKFTVMRYGSFTLDATLEIEPQEEYGRMKIVATDNSNTNFYGNYTIRRSSSKNNFTSWEDIYNIYENGSNKTLTYYDYTVESGIYYKYGIQKRVFNYANIALRGTLKESNIDMVYLESLLLNGEGKQLRLLYNGVVNSVTPTVNETKIEALGSKYPYIIRNSMNNYRVFDLKGTLTLLNNKYGDIIYETNEDHYMDYTYGSDFSSEFFNIEEYENNVTTPIKNENNDFVHNIFNFNNDNKDSLINKYNNYISDNGIRQDSNRIYEKLFRDRIIDFLTNENPKLLRSPDENNAIVKLMNVNLSPNQTLNGWIYDFSAQAVEIDECNLENYDYYGIHTIGENTLVNHYTVRFGQEYDIAFDTGSDIINNVLTNKYQPVTSKNTYISGGSYLSYLKIIFSPDSKKSNETCWHIRINGQEIIVPYKIGMYELRGDDINITDFAILDSDTKIDFYYVINLNEKDSIEQNSSVTYYKRYGQIWQMFDSEESVYKLILNKYGIVDEDNTTSQYLTVDAIDGIEIEAEEGVIFNIRDGGTDADSFGSDINENNKMNQFVMNKTQRLSIYDVDSIIYDFYFYGKRFYEYHGYGDIPENRFKYYDGIISEKIKTSKDGLQNNYLYRWLKKSTNTIFYSFLYKDKWYDLDIDSYTGENYIDVPVPVEACVNYIIELERGIKINNE